MILKSKRPVTIQRNAQNSPNHRTVTFKIPCLLILLSALFWNVPSTAWSAHGVSIDGSLKYPPNFSRFSYTSSHAKTGGDLTLHSLGGFDKMNPYTLKGTAADGLGSLVFETLAETSLDEPFAKYGLIAKDIQVAEDGLSVTFVLNQKARFSDGSAVTVDDIKFSLETIKSEQAHPFYQSYFNDIVSADILDATTIRFNFAKPNRELHLIACELPVLSKKFYSTHPFDASSFTPPLGSGPYIVEEVIAGKLIIYKKNPKYWAAQHPTRKGMFNFDTITYKYFKDQLVSVEAFKAGEFDFMPVNIAKQWQRDLNGPNFVNKKIIKDYLDHHNNAGMQGFVMNTRRKLFKDRNVRHALGLAFDFEWTNRSLFFGQYTRTTSYFSNSELAASGLPQGLELEFLQPFKDKLPPEIFTSSLPPVITKKNTLRTNLRTATKLLVQAGWNVKNGQLINQNNEPFTFEILLASPSFERVMAPYVSNLKKLGINATYRTIDPALYTRRVKSFDFDMVVNVFGQSQSPGNEQRDYWYSTSADRQGSRNIIGLKSDVVDNLVDKIIYAKTKAELHAACKALDRVLWYGYYVVPNWYVAKHRVAYWNIFGRPTEQPLYYEPEQALLTWWMQDKVE